MERQGARQVWVAAVVAVVVVVMVPTARFPLHPPPEMEEIVDRAREPERALGVVPVSLLCLVEELPEERVIEIRYRDDESLNSSIFILQTYLHGQETLLHLHLLGVLKHVRSIS